MICPICFRDTEKEEHQPWCPNDMINAYLESPTGQGKIQVENPDGSITFEKDPKKESIEKELEKFARFIYKLSHHNFYDRSYKGIVDDNSPLDKYKVLDYIESLSKKFKQQTREEIRKDLMKISEAGELEELRREVERYFSDNN